MCATKSMERRQCEYADEGLHEKDLAGLTFHFTGTN